MKFGLVFIPLLQAGCQQAERPKFSDQPTSADSDANNSIAAKKIGVELG